MIISNEKKQKPYNNNVNVLVCYDYLTNTETGVTLFILCMRKIDDCTVYSKLL